jgi:hypothetical protein
MSQDLFAAFGDTNDGSKKQQPAQTNPQSFSFFDDFTSTTISHQSTIKNPSEQAFTFQPFASAQDQPTGGFAADAGDDDFGDFEDAPTDATKPTEAATKTKSSDAWDDDPFASGSGPPPLQRKTTEWPSSNPRTQDLSQRPQEKPPLPKRDVAPRDPNVLFDAEDEELEDDFGEFEEAEEDVPVPAKTEEPDLLGFGDAIAPSLFDAKVQPKQISSSLLDLEALNFTDEPAMGQQLFGDPAKSENKHSRQASQNQKAATTGANPASIQERGIWESEVSSPTAPSIAIASKLKDVTAPTLTQEEEPWDDFNAWEQSTPAPSNPIASFSHPLSPLPKGPKIQEAWDEFNEWEQDAPRESSDLPPTQTQLSLVPASPSKLKEPSATELPPTNVPPPAVLLSLFPEIFATAEATFFKPTSTQPQNIRTGIYSDPTTTTYLQGIVSIATVCARIIAGRKQRWKRDVHLSQSMRIGPASTGKLSGMKVASVDKAETAKEDREATDVLRAWQAQVGRLKSAVAEAKKAGSAEIGAIPELRDVMPVRVAKEVEGGVPGFKHCALCGLKRDERVGKVDFNVQDSFGEWWIEGLNMHRGTFPTPPCYLTLLCITENTTPTMSLVH